MKFSEEILDFWFGKVENGLASAEKQAIWYQSSDETDAFIKEKFGPLFQQASTGQLADWQNSSRGSLALIIFAGPV